MDTAKEVFNTKVITIASDATVEEAIRVLLENRISGAPVTDENGTLLGVVSEFPLLEVIYSPKLKTAPVTKLMTRDVLTVEEGTLLSDIATLFVTHRIRRVPVLRDGRLVGVVSRADLLRHALTAGDELADLVESAQAVAE
jgi:CBS domain-containing protein